MKEDMHDYILGSELLTNMSFYPSQLSCDSLFIKNETISNTFIKNQLYIGSRTGTSELIGDYEESVVIYITDVNEKYVEFDIVGYEIKFEKDNKLMYFSKKYQEQFRSERKFIDKNTNNIFVTLGLYSDPDLGFEDDTPIFISPKSAATLRGWWQTNKQKEEKDTFKF